MRDPFECLMHSAYFNLVLPHDSGHSSIQGWFQGIENEETLPERGDTITPPPPTPPPLIYTFIVNCVLVLEIYKVTMACAQVH